MIGIDRICMIVRQTVLGTMGSLLPLLRIGYRVPWVARPHSGASNSTKTDIKSTFSVFQNPVASYTIL